MIAIGANLVTERLNVGAASQLANNKAKAKKNRRAGHRQGKPGI